MSLLIIKIIYYVIIFVGGIAIPAAVVGIMVGGYLLKRFQMTPKGNMEQNVMNVTVAV